MTIAGHGRIAMIWRAAIKAAFPGCAVSCIKDPSRHGRYRATIRLPSGAYCGTRADKPLEALQAVLALALEPAPGFPGWVEPNVAWNEAISGSAP
jgi:hypothetical protein